MPAEGERYIFRTRGVCPPEIHFQVRDGVLTAIDFRGGGCPGNAQLVSRLLAGRPLAEIRPLLKGIACRNATSCPDQLDQALEAVARGELLPARSFRLAADPWPKSQLALVGRLDGRQSDWEALKRAIRETGAIDTYCVGGLTGAGRDNRPILQSLSQAKRVLTVLSEQDWALAQAVAAGGEKSWTPEEKDYLGSLPQVLSFQMAGVPGMAFFGRYLQDLPEYSDFEPYALEMNMVSNLSQFMEDTAVFPALEAMVPQFRARVVIFGQTTRWGHWQVGGVDFIAAGPAAEGNCLRWGLLSAGESRISLDVRELSRN